MKQLICMKWGTLYGADYVNRLYRMIARNITGPFRLICLTDDAEGITPEVQCYPCPTIPLRAPECNYGWRKVTLWAKQIPGFESGDVLFLDLDTVITGSLDCFFEQSGDFIVCPNWTQSGQGIGNTSVYRFRIGAHTELLEKLIQRGPEMLAKYPNSQTYISREIKPGAMTFWPDSWCCSFKVHCVPSGPRRWFEEPHLPPGTKVVAFPGVPNPPDAAVGHWPAPWYKRFYKHIRPTSWVAQHWQ